MLVSERKPNTSNKMATIKMESNIALCTNTQGVLTSKGCAKDDADKCRCPPTAMLS